MWNPESALRGSVRYDLDHYKPGKGEMTLPWMYAAYNAGGPKASKALEQFKETRNYVQSIKDNRGWFHEQFYGKEYAVGPQAFGNLPPGVSQEQAAVGESVARGDGVPVASGDPDAAMMAAFNSQDVAPFRADMPDAEGIAGYNPLNSAGGPGGGGGAGGPSDSSLLSKNERLWFR